MMQDGRIVVRDAARVALTSFCKTIPLNRNDLIGHGALHRHAGVLGIGSLIESAPYSISPWLPELLAYQRLILNSCARLPNNFS
jgi:hypothetical protein